VQDSATRSWMLAFYLPRLDQRDGTVQVVRFASEAELRGRRSAGRTTHPLLWSSFLASSF